MDLKYIHQARTKVNRWKLNSGVHQSGDIAVERDKPSTVGREHTGGFSQGTQRRGIKQSCGDIARTIAIEEAVVPRHREIRRRWEFDDFPNNRPPVACPTTVP